MNRLFFPIKQLEVNPRWQFHFHGFFATCWLLVMVVVPFVTMFHENLAGMFLLEASLWANFATHFGAMSSALAAISENRTPPPRKLG